MVGSARVNWQCSRGIRVAGGRRSAVGNVGRGVLVMKQERPRMPRWLVLVALLAARFFAIPNDAHAAGPVGEITEVDVGGGQAEVRRVSRQDWRPAGGRLWFDAGGCGGGSHHAPAIAFSSHRP